jgi:hypothetical protein
MIDSPCGKGSAAVIPVKPLTKTRRPEPDNSPPLYKPGSAGFQTAGSQFNDGRA